ncbi:MAG TPA: response regulator [Candidatus Saccharimonadales bacterium]|nr:response regulator [Candidatus Saccharimonadales bacterium]
MKNKILIIEDELSYLRLLRDQLTERGYTVIEATDGKEGLATARLQHPDLILLDIRMPVMNGMIMLDELRKDSYGKSAKVIILTNIEPSDRILKKVLVDLPTYYLIKSDIQLAELMEKIQELLVE